MVELKSQRIYGTKDCYLMILVGFCFLGSSFLLKFTGVEFWGTIRGFFALSGALVIVFTLLWLWRRETVEGRGLGDYKALTSVGCSAVLFSGAIMFLVNFDIFWLITVLIVLSPGADWKDLGVFLRKNLISLKGNR